MPSQIVRIFIGATLLVTNQAASQATDTVTSKQGGALQPAAALPPGWTARPDEGGEPSKIRFVAMEPGYHLTLGPATILYRTEDLAQGPFHTLATFHQMKKPRHPEGYGLFVGGKQLKGKDQTYTYFLVREDGAYLIKQRKGDITSEVTKGWKPSRAIKKADAQGKATNLLEIDAKQDPKKVDFKVNGQIVYSAPADQMDLTGIVGLRVNHTLDVHIEGFAVHQ
ncbi:MAG TPA: hypothetical protein VKB22_00960 [Gemmatimonadales bacterium]|nr:hypothetical protein [Gemmatimonadales bacterium]